MSEPSITKSSCSLDQSDKAGTDYSTLGKVEVVHYKKTGHHQIPLKMYYHTTVPQVYNELVIIQLAIDNVPPYNCSHNYTMNFA